MGVAHHRQGGRLMSDSRTAERARVIAQHYLTVWIDRDIRCGCGHDFPTISAWAEHVAQTLTPAIDEQTTDTYLLAVGSCIALIDATTHAAVTAETDHNSRIIQEWAGKVVTAMRYASAAITPGRRR